MERIHLNLLKRSFHFMESPLVNLTEFVHTNQEWLKKEHERLKKEIKDWESQNPADDEHAMDSYSWFEQEILKHQDFDSAFYNSQLLIAYSTFEVLSKEICLKMERFSTSKIKLNDLEGSNYIEKSKKYLSKVIDIDISDLNTQWETIIRYQKIRNVIAHNNRVISTDRLGDFQKIISTLTHVKITDDFKPEVKITDAKFITKFCAIANDYLREIMKRIIQKLNQGE